MLEDLRMSTSRMVYEDGPTEVMACVADTVSIGLDFIKRLRLSPW